MDARRNKLISWNPSDETDRPHKEIQETKILSNDQMDIFLEEIKKYRYYAGYLLSIGSELRPGEVLALKWSNLDLKEKTITIEETLTRVLNDDPNAATKTKVITQEAKNSKKQKNLSFGNETCCRSKGS